MLIPIGVAINELYRVNKQICSIENILNVEGNDNIIAVLVNKNTPRIYIRIGVE